MITSDVLRKQAQGFATSENELLHEFSIECMNRDIFKRRQDVLRDMDIIDLRQSEKTEKLENMGTVEEMFYRIVPPFETGVLISKSGGYMKWEIIDINLDDLSLIIHLSVYTFIGKGMRKTWLCMLDGRYNMTTIRKSEQLVVDAKEYHCPIMEIDPASFKWLQPKIMKWNGLVNRVNIDPPELAKRCASEFIESIEWTNWTLEHAKEKPKKKREPKKTKTSISDNTETPKRVTRVLNGIEFKSESVPRASGPRSITYKTPSWTRRGFVRHYKSGKTAYIKPCECHRVGMNEEANPAPTTTIIK